MKFDSNNSDLQIVGDIQENKVGIDIQNLDFIVTILSTNLYSDPIGSFLRETVSNAFDSHVEAGVDDPVLLILNKDLDDEYFCEIQDFGVGLSPERFDKIYKNIGSSTKRDSNEQIGGFGIGRFAALAYCDMVNITSTYDGIRTNYVMYKDGNSINISILSSLPTEDRNGVSVKIPIQNYDVNKFYDSIFSQLSYFNNLYVNFENKDKELYFNSQKIKNYNNFKVLKYSSPIYDNRNSLKILLGKVAYPINYTETNISYGTFISMFAEKHNISNITEGELKSRMDNGDLNSNKYFSFKKLLSKINIESLNIVLKFEIGDLSVVPNREQILYNSKSNQIIFNKFYEAVYEILNNIYNQSLSYDAKTIDEFIRYKENNISYLIADNSLCSSASEDIKIRLESLDKLNDTSIIVHKTNISNISTNLPSINLTYKGIENLNHNYFNQLKHTSRYTFTVSKEFNIYDITNISIKPSKKDIFSLNFNDIENTLIDLVNSKRVIFMSREMYNNLSALDKRFLRYEHDGKIIIIYKDIDKFINGFKTKNYLLQMYNIHSTEKFFAYTIYNTNLKDFYLHLKLYMLKLESNFKLILKKSDLSNIVYTKDFLLEEERQKEIRKNKRAFIDYNEVFNLNVVARNGETNYKGNYTVDVVNLNHKQLSDYAKNGLVVYTYKNDDRLSEFINIFNRNRRYTKNNSRIPFLAVQIAKTKIDTLNKVSKEIKNLINLDDMITNPKDFRYIRDAGTVFKIHDEYPYILDIYNNSFTMKILKDINIELYNEIISIGQLTSKIRTYEINKFKNEAISKQIYEICKKDNLFNISVLSSINKVEKHKEALNLISNICSGIQKLAYNVSTSDNTLTLSNSVAKLLLKSKVLRPDFNILNYKS